MHVHPDFQQQGVGSALLSECAPHLDGSHAYCLPYMHLVRFYQQIKFEVAEADELPTVLSDRLAMYVSAGHKVLAMKRLPCA
jgi:predicted N-acetyltransferase YhbS